MLVSLKPGEGNLTSDPKRLGNTVDCEVPDFRVTNVKDTRWAACGENYSGTGLHLQNLQKRMPKCGVILGPFLKICPAE